MFKSSFFILGFLALSTISGFGQIKFDFVADEHDFGVVEEGDQLTWKFEFANGGEDSIHLKKESRDVRPGCSCTASEYTEEAIPPGGKGFIKAGYATHGRIGSFNKTITVSQKGTPYKILTIKGVVVKKTETQATYSAAELKKAPVFNMDKKAHDFGKTETGKSLTHIFSIKNDGKDTLKILSSLAACNCIKYKLTDVKDNSEQSFVLKGKTANLEITYTPSAFSGLSDAFSGDILTLFTNDPKNQKIELSLQAEIIQKK